MKRTLCILLSVMMLLSSVVFCLPTYAAVDPMDGGIVFGAFAPEYNPRVKQGDHLYYLSHGFESAPHTYEAWVCMATTTNEAGVLLSNKNEAGLTFVSIEVSASGVPIFKFNDNMVKQYKASFDSVNLFTGKWEHIAFVHDAKQGTVSFYLNGQLKGELGFYPDLDSDIVLQPFIIGGDGEYQNHPPFNGAVKEIRFYSDVRSASEIASDVNTAPDKTDENLLAAFEMRSEYAMKDIEDLSNNDNDLIYSNMWLSEAEMELIRSKSDFERAYSFAVIGDTQYSTQFYPENLTPLYQWIATNKEKYNIQYAIGLGDITNRDTIYEWDNAKRSISVLDGVVPYSLVRGNHDLKDYSASANSSYHETQTGTALGLSASQKGAAFDKYFAKDTESATDYVDQFINNGENGGVYDEGSVMNTWRLLEIENSKWLLLNLDYAPSDDVLAWASDVVDAHPDHKVIVSTHSYLDRNGTHTKEGAYAGEKGKAGITLPSGTNNVNLGEHIWQKFVKKHENIELVLSGHVDSARIVTVHREGENGNHVTEMLVDPQTYDSRFRGAGFIAMLYFNADGTACEVEYISTASESKGLYYRNINQFTVDLTKTGIPYDENEWNRLANEPSGTGSAKDPYIIENAGNLLWMANSIQKTTNVGTFAGKYFKQVKDIDLYGHAILPIGTQYIDSDNIYAFGGIYDGCGYTIKNGIVSAAVDNAFTKDYGYGLFGVVCGGTVKNVTLDNITVVGRGTVGTLVGRTAGRSDGSSKADFNLISGCYVKSSCKVVTQLPDGKSGAQSSAFDSADKAGVVGGIVGIARSATVQYCKNDSDITASGDFSKLGGIVGTAGYNTHINYCVNNGTLAFKKTSPMLISVAGGILGATTNMTITDDVADNCAGTLYITNCVNTKAPVKPLDASDMSAVSYGGIVGAAGRFVKADENAYVIDGCAVTADILPFDGATVDDRFGAIVGNGMLTDGTPDEGYMIIENSQATGSVLYNNDPYKTKDGHFAIEEGLNNNTMAPVAVLQSVADTITDYTNANTGDIDWYVDGTTLYVTGGGNMPNFEQGTAPWYSYKDTVTKVVFGDSILTIGDFAFYGFEALETVVTSRSVVGIGLSAFDNTAFISDPANKDDGKVYLGNILVKIDASADGNYDIPGATVGFADGALSEVADESVFFFDGSSAEWSSIHKGEHNDALDTAQVVCSADQFKWLFDKNTGTLKIFGSGVTPTFNSSSTDTPYYKYKDVITSIVIEEGITGLGNYLAKNFTNVTSVSLPSTLKTIGTACFSAHQFESITLPEGLETIGNYAFENAPNLKSIDIPASVKNLNRYAFSSCASLESATGGEGITAAGQNVFQGTKLVAAADERTDGLLVLGHTILKAFNKVDDTFNINCNIKVIAINAFSGITVPKVKYCGTEAEWNKISIGTGNENLTKVARTYTTIHWDYDDSTDTLYITGSGAMTNYNPNNAASNKHTPWYDYKTTAKKVVIGEGITTIGDRVFRDFSVLAEANIPNGVTYIGTGAFELTNLTGKIVIPNTVTTMKNYVFSDANLTEVVLPDSLTAVGTYVFNGNTNLTTITVPKSIISFGNNSLRNCNSLTTINYGGCAPDWQKVTFGSNNTAVQNATVNYTHAFNKKASATQATPADCDNAATYFVQCDNCDAVSDTKTVAVGTKNGHSFTTKDSGQMASAADCNAPQKNYIQCDNCDALSDTKTIEVGTKNDHSFTLEPSDIVADSGNCQTKQKNYVKCDNCDAVSDTKTVEVDVFGAHSHTTKDSGQKAEDATCKQAQKNYVQCDNCNAVSDTVKVSVGDVSDHKYENYVSNNNATCQKNCTETSKCKWCDETDTRDIADSKVTHKYENYVSNNDATCKSNCTETSKCKWCDETDTRDIADSKVTHKYENYVSNNDATCQKNCTETSKCTWCDETDTRDIADSKVTHKFENYKSDNNATCKSNCTETSKCKWCDETDTRDIADTKADHKFENYVSDNNATCKSNCTETSKCKWCDETDTRDIADTKADHKFENYVSDKNATCCEDGTKTAKCKWCDLTDTIADKGTATGHKNTTKIFSDVADGKWYVDAINYNYTHNFISGMSADKFGISTPVTRGMFITILARIAGVDTTKNNVSTKFTDVANGKYYTAAIKWASENGIVNGMSATTFEPNSAIQRQQLCVMIVNFAKFMKIDLTKAEDEIAFTDSASIAKWAKDAVKACQMADIVNGYANGAKFEFKPTNTATRAEAAQILYKFHKDFVAAK